MALRRVASKLRLGGPFVKPVFTLVTGAAVGQALAFIARPVLTRLFTPEEFGVLTVFSAATGLFTAISTGKYDDALMLPKEKRDASNLFVLALLLACIATPVLAITLLWTTEIGSLLQSPGLVGVLFLLPITVTLSAWAITVETWHTRFDRYKLVSTSQVVRHSTVVAIKIATGIAGIGAIGLVSGATAGLVVFVATLGVASYRLDWKNISASISLTSMRKLARTYWRFPAFSLPGGFLNLASTGFLALLIAAFFGEEAVGFYGLALGTLHRPVSLFTYAVGQVFFVRAATAYREKKLGMLTEVVYRRLIAISLFPMLVVAFCGPDLFAFVFGDPWREAGLYGQFLSMWLFVSTTASPLTRLFDITQHQRADLFFGILLFGSQIVTLFLTRNSVDPITAIAAISFVGFAGRTTQVIYLLRIGNASHVYALKTLLLHVLLGCVVLAPAAYISWSGGSILYLCIALAVATIVYAMVVVRMDWKSPKKGRDIDT